MKNFRFKLIQKILILTFILTGGFYLFFKYDNTLYLISTALLVVWSIIDLIKYVDMTNRDLARFLSSIRYSDFSQSFGSTKPGASFNALNESITKVMDEFRKTRAEKEEQNRYLQTVLRHIHIGLLSYNESGKIEFINKAAQNMLGITRGNPVVSISRLPADFRNKLFDLKPGERLPVKIFTDSEMIQLIVYSTVFRMHEQEYTLVSFQNIQMELEEKELEAWQKLIRVLTHEIMNSVTPISSLAATVNGIFKNNKNLELTAEEVEDIKHAVKTIEKRSMGLIDFVNNYRNLTKIPKPDFEIVSVKQLFNQIHKLMKNDLENNDIEFITAIEPRSLEITADPAMIEQVLINLILNAINALKSCKHRSVKLRAQLNHRGKVILDVSDNGPGIPEEIKEKVFIPFFSTKKEGSGIGLSLARQIMRAHGGNIRLTSEPYKSTTFSLIF